MPTPSFAAAADPHSNRRMIPRHPRDNPADLALVRQLALALGEPEVVVMQNLLLDDGHLSWTPRFVIARANRSGLLKGRLRWAETPPGTPLAVTASVTLAGDGREAHCTVSLKAAEEDGRIAPGTPEDEVLDHLYGFAATRLIDRHFPDLLLALPPARPSTTRLPATDEREAASEPQERVVYDEYGNADPRRPTSAERLLERVERHLERAGHPERVLDLNAAALTAAATELDDGSQRLAALWRRHSARIEPVEME